MPQDVERYLYFTVALLKDSNALDALWQDALKYHMIDQPGKLIAMRLTEYYENRASGMIPPTTDVHTAARPMNNGATLEQPAIAHTPVLKVDNEETMMNTPFDNYDDDQPHYIESENLVSTSPDVAQNAEAAADYWTVL